MGLQGVVPPGQDDSGATSSILSINLLGKFSLHVGDHEIELLSRKTKALLGYLALQQVYDLRGNKMLWAIKVMIVGRKWKSSSDLRARGAFLYQSAMGATVT